MGICDNCGSAITPGSTICGSCGSPVKQSTQPTQQPSSGGYCGVCGTQLSSKYSPCPKCGHVKTTFAPKQTGGGFCGSCGATLTQKYAPCPSCGYTKTRYNPSIPSQGSLYKNEGTALVLSIVLGFFGVCGIGQIYASKVGRGVVMLIVGIVLAVIGFATMGIGLIAYLGFFIWQIFDTRKLCREYNDFVSQNGRAPW